MTKKKERVLIELSPHSFMTPNETLQKTLREGFTDVLVLGYDEDGELIIRSSAMKRHDALWMIEKAKLYILDEQ